jgi:hypothetical protein
MGVDPTALGNHRLNTTGIAALAADLSTIFNAEVTYGYQQDDEPFDDVVLGIAGAGKSKKMWLRDYENPLAPRPPHDNGLQYECSGFDNGCGEEISMNIYRDSFEATPYFGGRWGYYVRTYNGRYGGWPQMLAYRRKVYGQIQLLGGDTALIYADSGSGYALQGNPYHTPFHQLVQHMVSHPGFLRVSDWMRDENAPFLDDPMVFLDDFSYWPSDAQMVERAIRAGNMEPY